MNTVARSKCLYRNIIECFGHLSESDKSILMKYPFHRVGSLLSQEEAQSSSVVRDTLDSKAGEDGNGKLQRIQTVTVNKEERSESTEVPQVLNSCLDKVDCNDPFQPLTSA